MTKVFLYCDESGAKGYANQNEAYPGEIGVFAGIMVPEERLEPVKLVFDEIAARFSVSLPTVYKYANYNGEF